MPRQKKQRLKRRKDGRYCCVYHGIQFMGLTEDEALQKREEYKRGNVIRTNQTVGEYAEYWLPIHKASVKPITYNAYVSILSSALQPISGVPLSKLSSDHISEAYSALTGKSASYLHKAKILLTEILDSAVDAGYMLRNPARAKSVKPPRGPKGTHRAITAEERTLIETTPHRMQLAALLMLYCGLRRGEMLAVTAADFHGDTLSVSRAVSYVGNQPILSTPKTATSVRDVPEPAPILKMLPPSGYITGGDKPMTETAFSRAWASYCRALGARIRAHDLRHSYCTWLRDAGVDIKQSMRWLGHADEKMILRIYDHPGEEREIEAKKLLSSAFHMQNDMQKDGESHETFEK